VALADDLLGDDYGGAELVEYVNVPPTTGAALSSGKASYSELNAMSVEDLHDILEVVSVDNRNRRAVQHAHEMKHALEVQR
jgi:hypothetical protein